MALEQAPGSGSGDRQPGALKGGFGQLQSWGLSGPPLAGPHLCALRPRKPFGCFYGTTQTLTSGLGILLLGIYTNHIREMFSAASRINSPKLEPEKPVKRQIHFPSSEDVGCSLEVPKDGPPLSHGRGWPSTQPQERMGLHSATGKDGPPFSHGKDDPPLSHRKGWILLSHGNSQRDECTWAQTKMQTKRLGCRVHFCGILENAKSSIVLKTYHCRPGVGFEWERAADNFCAMAMLCGDWQWINGFVHLSKLTELNS